MGPSEGPGGHEEPLPVHAAGEVGDAPVGVRHRSTGMCFVFDAYHVYVGIDTITSTVSSAD